LKDNCFPIEVVEKLDEEGISHRRKNSFKEEMSWHFVADDVTWLCDGGDTGIVLVVVVVVEDELIVSRSKD
jgi:hypothetical protein